MLEASGSAELSYKQLTSKLNSSQRAQEKVLNAGKRSRHCFILRDWGIHLTSICILPCTKPALRSLAARITHGPCSQSWQGNSTSSSSSCYISAVRKTPCRGGQAGNHPTTQTPHPLRTCPTATASPRTRLSGCRCLRPRCTKAGQFLAAVDLGDNCSQLLFAVMHT